MNGPAHLLTDETHLLHELAHWDHDDVSSDRWDHEEIGVVSIKITAIYIAIVCGLVVIH